MGQFLPFCLKPRAPVPIPVTAGTPIKETR
jgi:hypothetical protein